MFDETYTPLEAKSTPVGATAGVKEVIILPQINITQTGYLYVYLSYDNQAGGQDVYFDEFKITYQESPVIQINSYYPFGMTAFSWVRSGEEENKYLYQGKEYQSLTGLHDFHARQYDAALGRWFAVDPAGQFGSPYLAMGNSPTMGVDPDGEFFWIIPQIGWSKEGGFSIGVSFVFGIPGVASFQVGGGYNFRSRDGYGYAAATIASNTVSLSYSGSGGWSAGYTAGASVYSGLPISTNFLTVGANYNISNNSWSGNLSAWQVDRNGWMFNPSVSAKIAPDRTTNLFRGKGFRSNDKVLADFVAAKDHQGALDYFGFKGYYDPEEVYSRNPQAAGITDPYTGDIFYHDAAFRTFDKLEGVADHEMWHRRDVLSERNRLMHEDLTGETLAKGEHGAYMHNFRRQGIYPGLLSLKSYEFQIRINGLAGNIYTPKNMFSTKWWHRIYRVPRLF